MDRTMLEPARHLADLVAGAGLPDWPRHDPASARLLNFTNEGPQAMDDPRRAMLDLWATVQDGR
jgi:hypothetical protein